MRIVIHASVARSLINFRGPLVKAFCESGHEVHAIAPAKQEDARVVSLLESWGVIFHSLSMQRTGTNPLVDVRTLAAYFKLFKKIEPDIVIGYTIKPVIYGTLAARLAKVPKRYVLITGLGYTFTGQARGKRAFIQCFVRFMYRQALKNVALVFFQNPDDEAAFRDLMLINSNVPSLVVNGSGIDITAFPVAPIQKGAMRFLLIARLLGDKGVREYIGAAQKIRERYSDVIFRLVGDIDSNPDSIEPEELENWINAGVIEYLGRLEDVRPALEASSVYVLPSYREGTPRTVLEAMSMGRAIITTDAPGCRETVVEGRNGYLVPVKSVDALVFAMEKFIKMPELANSMGQRSRQMVIEKYDVEKVNKLMLEAMKLE